MRVYALLAAVIGFLAVFAVALWFRGEAIKAKTDRDNWRKSAETYLAVNKTNLATIHRMEAARLANDQLATQLAADLAEIKARGVETRTVVREVYRNEPESRDWGNMPVPDSLRNAADAGR